MGIVNEMSGIWVIAFDEPGRLLNASGTGVTYLSDEAMRFIRQEPALDYLERNRSVIEALGTNPGPTKHPL